MLVTAEGPGSVALGPPERPRREGRSGTGPGPRARTGESGVVVSAVRCVSRVSVCLVDYFNTSSCQDAKGLLDLDP